MTQSTISRSKLRELAEKCAKGIHRDITGRKGIGDELESYDDEIQAEILQKWQDIIESALREAEDKWQPIETAPKDGTRIILLWSGRVLPGFYLDNSKTMAPWQGFRPMSGEITPSGQPDSYQLFPPPPGSKP